MPSEEQDAFNNNFNRIVTNGGVKGYVDAWNKWREHKRPIRTKHIRITQVNYPNSGSIDIMDANFNNVSFDGCDLKRLHFFECKFTNADFINTHIDKVQFIKCQMDGATFSGKLKKVEFGGAENKKCNLNGALFIGSFMENVSFVRCDLGHTNFNQASLLDVYFKISDLTKSRILNLRDYRNITFDNNTSVKDLKVDRHVLSSLTDSGGLSDHERHQMLIKDDLGTLRQLFGGIWGLLHLLSLSAFFAPHIYFLAHHWTIPYLTKIEGDSITLFRALCLTLYNGGIDISSNIFKYHYTFALFVIMLLYNVARFALLFKTKKLEYKREITGLESDFSFSPQMLMPGFTFKLHIHPTFKLTFKKSVFSIPTRWGALHWIVKLGLPVSVVLAVWNLIHFLQAKIPLSTL